MGPIGFSTGALALGAFARGLELVRSAGLPAVELSALREPELPRLLAALDHLEDDLQGMAYVSVHGPSAIAEGHEREIVEQLQTFADRGLPVIVHPDVISDVALWRRLGAALTIENNDRRKSSGKRCADLAQLFDAFPDAGFCLDLGHAKQVDRTMTEAYFMLKRFGPRLRQLHVSEVTTRSRHEGLSAITVRAFRQVARLIPEDVPVIIESLIDEANIAKEVALVKASLTVPPRAPGELLGTTPFAITR